MNIRDYQKKKGRVTETEQTEQVYVKKIVLSGRPLGSLVEEIREVTANHYRQPISEREAMAIEQWLRDNELKF